MNYTCNIKDLIKEVSNMKDVSCRYFHLMDNVIYSQDHD